MAVPARKTSHARKSSRRSSVWKLEAPTLVTCSNCGETETREITASEKGHTIRVPNEENEGYCSSCGQYRCLFCEKDEHMHQVSDNSVMTFFIHVIHYFYHLFSNFRYTLSHR